MKSKIDISYTFWKLKNIIDICHDKRKIWEYTFSLDEVLSIWLSNFDGNELILFREAQKA